MPEDAFLGRLVVVRGNKQRGIRAGLFGKGGQTDGLGGIVGPRTRQYGNTPFHLLNADADGAFMLLMGHGGGFARGSARQQGMDPLFQLPLYVGAKGFLINAAVSERRDQRGNGSVKHATSPEEQPEGGKGIAPRKETFNQRLLRSCGARPPASRE